MCNQPIGGPGGLVHIEYAQDHIRIFQRVRSHVIHILAQAIARSVDSRCVHKYRLRGGGGQNGQLANARGLGFGRDWQDKLCEDAIEQRRFPNVGPA